MNPITSQQAEQERRLRQIRPAASSGIRILWHERLAGSADDGAVLTRGPAGALDTATVCAPEVHYDGSVYRMWYVGSPGPTAYGGEYAAPACWTWNIGDL